MLGLGTPCLTALMKSMEPSPDTPVGLAELGARVGPGPNVSAVMKCDNPQALLWG